MQRLGRDWETAADSRRATPTGTASNAERSIIILSTARSTTTSAPRLESLPTNSKTIRSLRQQLQTRKDNATTIKHLLISPPPPSLPRLRDWTCWTQSQSTQRRKRCLLLRQKKKILPHHQRQRLTTFKLNNLRLELNSHRRPQCRANSLSSMTTEFFESRAQKAKGSTDQDVKCDGQGAAQQIAGLFTPRLVLIRSTSSLKPVCIPITQQRMAGGTQISPLSLIFNHASKIIQVSQHIIPSRIHSIEAKRNVVFPAPTALTNRVGVQGASRSPTKVYMYQHLISAPSLVAHLCRNLQHQRTDAILRRSPHRPADHQHPQHQHLLPNSRSDSLSPSCPSMAQLLFPLQRSSTRQYPHHSVSFSTRNLVIHPLPGVSLEEDGVEWVV